jgi:hypothetical protein
MPEGQPPRLARHHDLAAGGVPDGQLAGAQVVEHRGLVAAAEAQDVDGGLGLDAQRAHPFEGRREPFDQLRLEPRVAGWDSLSQHLRATAPSR